MTKKKKLILEWEEETDENYILGIVSSSSHLEFVHFLNQTEYFNFERGAEIEIETGQGNSHFICFTNNDRENNNEYKLFKNKGTIGTLAKEFKGLDYIMVHNPENSDPMLEIKELVQQQKLVQAVIEIEIQKLSDKTKKILGL